MFFSWSNFKFEDNKYRTYMYKKEALQPFECGLKLVSFCKDTVIEPSLMFHVGSTVPTRTAPTRMTPQLVPTRTTRSTRTILHLGGGGGIS